MNFGGHTRIVNSTISGNSASFGAGINMGDIHNLTITNSTIAFNRERQDVTSGCLSAVAWYGEFNLDSTILYGNTCGAFPRDIHVDVDDPDIRRRRYRLFTGAII